MPQLKFSLVLAALLGGGLLLGACGGNASDTSTSTPTSTLGTDSAATKVGGTAPADTMSIAPPPTGASTSAPSTGQQPQ